MECKHKRIKKTYTHGYRSAPKRFCKDCLEIIPRKLNSEKNKFKSKRRYNNYDRSYKTQDTGN